MKLFNSRNYLLPWIFTFCSLSLALCPGVKALLQGNRPIYDPQLAVLTATLIAIIWYTWEAHSLRKETQRQTEIQQRPFVILESMNRDNSGYLLALEMKNIGNGCAININFRGDRDLASIPFLAKGENRLLRILTQFSKGEPPRLVLNGNEYTLFLDPESAKGTAFFTIQFQNVEMQSYFVKQNIASSGLEILCSGRIKDLDMRQDD